MPGAEPARWPAVAAVALAALFLALAAHAHSARPAALAAATNTLVRGAFQRAEAEERVHWTRKENIDEPSYVAGEQHVMHDVFKQQTVEDAAVKEAFYNARDKMSRILEATIERQEAREEVAAVDAERRKHWVQPKRVEGEMRNMYSDIYHSHQLMYNFNKLGEEVRGVEDKICDGHPCKHWHALLDKTQAKAQDLEQFRGRKHVMTLSKHRVAEDMARDEKEAQHYKELATEYFNELQQTPPPPPPPPPTPPPHCKGLVTLLGPSGSVDTGGPATDPEHNDCRWLIKSTSSAIVLHFPDFHVKGDEGRVSIFVGPENVALYKNEDVINWASAFKSFTGDAYPNPIVCPSSEVLVVFKTDAANAFKSKLKMTWGPTSAAKEIARESLAVLRHPEADGSHQVLMEKPAVIVHKTEPKPEAHKQFVPKAAVREAKETEPEKRLIGNEKMIRARVEARDERIEAEKRMEERKVVRESAEARERKMPARKFLRETKNKFVRRVVEKKGVRPFEKKVRLSLSALAFPCECTACSLLNGR